MTPTSVPPGTPTPAPPARRKDRPARSRSDLAGECHPARRPCCVCGHPRRPTAAVGTVTPRSGVAGHLPVHDLTADAIKRRDTRDGSMAAAGHGRHPLMRKDSLRVDTTCRMTAPGAEPVSVLPSRRWWQGALLVMAGLLGVGLVLTWILRAVQAPWTPWALLPLSSVPTRMGPIIEPMIYLTAAVLALACAVLADGREALGLGRRPVAHHTRAVGYFLLGPTAAFVVAWFVLNALHHGPSALAATVLQDSSSRWSPLYLLQAGAAGIFEEVIVVALAYRLLEYLPGGEGRRFATTGIATALLVTLRVAYHLYNPMLAVALIPMAWLTVRLYRHTRTVLPLIIGHVAFNLINNLPAGSLGLITVGVLLLTITVGPRPTAALGFTPTRRAPTPMFFWRDPIAWPRRPATHGKATADGWSPRSAAADTEPQR